MIEEIRGDLFTSSAQALVNPINCVGVMGKGLALQFRQRYPAMFEAYRMACHRHEVAPGRLFVFPEYDGKVIIGFPTKVHWRDVSHESFIERGLARLVRLIRTYPLSSIALPALGCGLGGLSWDRVRPLVWRYLATLESVQVSIYLT